MTIGSRVVQAWRHRARPVGASALALLDGCDVAIVLPARRGCGRTRQSAEIEALGRRAQRLSGIGRQVDEARGDGRRRACGLRPRRRPGALGRDREPGSQGDRHGAVRAGAGDGDPRHRGAPSVPAVRACPCGLGRAATSCSSRVSPRALLAAGAGALQHGEGGAGGARAHARQRGAQERDPRERGGSRPRCHRDGAPPCEGDGCRGHIELSTRVLRSGESAVPRTSPTPSGSCVRMRPVTSPATCSSSMGEAGPASEARATDRPGATSSAQRPSSVRSRTAPVSALGSHDDATAGPAPSVETAALARVHVTPTMAATELWDSIGCS